MAIEALSSLMAGTPAVPGTPGAEPTVANQSLGKDAFLKLLVAQLKYQNPFEPADSTEFMGQTAQFSMVEKLDELTKLNTDLIAGQRTLAGSSMIGKSVVYPDELSGEDASGVVTSARFAPEGVVLMVGDTEVPLARVKEVTPDGDGTTA